jgi:hypothetical protein
MAAMGIRRSPARVACAALGLASALASAPGRAAAQSADREGRSAALDLGAIFAIAPGTIERVLGEGHEQLFRLVEDLQLFDMQHEIDRYVGDPRDLNDSTAYKLSLLPYHIRYPVYRSLVAQMTRLDALRSRRIQTVTPDSVSLIDLRIQPVATLEELDGLGAGGEIQRSLQTIFTPREVADLSVFLLSQEPFFPETPEGWEVVKRAVAPGAVPFAAGALATGSVFDAAALSHSGNLAGGETLRRGWYGGFRKLGVHLHPHLRGGLTVAAGSLQAAAGLADQVRPTPNQQDRALELAVREGWLNQLTRPLGVDSFFEVAVSRSIEDQVGFTGDRTASRAGLFFKRDALAPLPTLVLRGSAEAASNLVAPPHVTTALGVEHPRSGLTAMVQASRTPAPTGGVAETDDRLTAILAGTSEPVSAVFVEAMRRQARHVEREWEGLEGVEDRRATWERLLGARAWNASPGQAQRALRELEQILAERDTRVEALAVALGDYLDSRRRAYAILGWSGAPDGAHGPLPAEVLLAARGRVLDRLNVLTKDLEGATARLEPTRGRLARLEQEILQLAARDPGEPRLTALREEQAAVEREWSRETESLKLALDAHDRLKREAAGIAAAFDRDRKGARPVDTLPATVRRRLASWASGVRP